MAKLLVSVNKNKTKEGIKIQFVIPETVNDEQKQQLASKYQLRLSNALSKYGLTPSLDTNVPYSNIIGFFIPIQNIQSLIQNALK